MVHFEAGRQFGIWYLQTVEAVSALTNLAEEVRMLVVVVLLAVTVAEFVFRAVAAALDGMHQNRVRARKIFDLSMVSIRRSSSANDCGSMELANALTTTIRFAVGLMPCSSSKLTHDFSSMGAKVQK